MNRVSIWVTFISLFLLLHMTNSVEEETRETRNSLISFLTKLSNNNGQPDLILGWNSTLDPCKDSWPRVACDRRNTSVTKLFLDGLNLNGTLDATSLCGTRLAASLYLLSLASNNIGGGIPAEISKCKQLTYIYVRGNQFSGNLPSSFPMLGNLKRLDISNNKFSGNLPEFSRISGLTMFLAQNNQLSGEIPKFDFSNLVQFDVSNNNFSGLIPDGGSRFPTSSFLGNPELCGDPLSQKCASLEETVENESKGVSKNQILMYSGYAALALVFLMFIIFKVCKRKKREERVEAANKVASIDVSMISKHNAASSEDKSGVSRSEYMEISAESQQVSTSLIVLESPVVNGLKFEDLLSAPAELLGRGKHGTLYKVMFENGIVLVVKRIKDWAISSTEFKQRMQRMGEVKHPNVMPALAFYCSTYEKLLVYEYQPNGSLFGLLHGTPMSQAFDWASRIGVAASISEALAFIHQELKDDGVAHGNLKSCNILMNKNMEPCISEYGLISLDSKYGSSLTRSKSSRSRAFQGDIYGLGVILLELLTGKMAQNSGVDLADWVVSVVREEWTTEVFDKVLISEGASEERLLNLLQVAIKCVNNSPDARPSINQVATMINTLKDEDDRSMSFEPSLQLSLA